jgi:hypothetical protein
MVMNRCICICICVCGYICIVATWHVSHHCLCICICVYIWIVATWHVPQVLYYVLGLELLTLLCRIVEFGLPLCALFLLFRGARVGYCMQRRRLPAARYSCLGALSRARALALSRSLSLSVCVSLSNSLALSVSLSLETCAPAPCAAAPGAPPQHVTPAAVQQTPTHTPHATHATHATHTQHVEGASGRA